MNEGVIAKVKASIEKMPPLSPVIHKVVLVANNPRASAQDLMEVIQMDPVLTARVLKMVNSSYFGYTQEISSLKQGIVILGINTIKNVALSSVVVSNINVKNNTVFNGEEFWKHSFGVGVASKIIARMMGVDQKLLEEFFVAGLIHDIGKVLISNVFPEETRKIDSIAAGGKYTITFIEKKIIGLSHEEIGIAIGKNWNFENNFLYAMGRHHSPVLKGASARYSIVTAVANYLVNVMGLCSLQHGLLEPFPQEVWQALGLEEEAVRESLNSLGVEIEKARIFLQ